MTVCVHNNVCREYMRRGSKILCASCPDRCPYFEEKRDDEIKVSMKDIGEIVMDSYMHAGRYNGGLR